MIRVNEQYNICLDEPNYFSKLNFRDDMCHGSKVVMFLF